MLGKFDDFEALTRDGLAGEAIRFFSRFCEMLGCTLKP